jgi:hypothetical protein
MEHDRGQVWVEGLGDRKLPLLCALENVSKVAKAAFTTKQKDYLKQALEKRELDSEDGRKKVAEFFSKPGKVFEPDVIHTWYDAEKASEKASEYDQGPEIQQDFDLAKGLKFNEALISQFNVDPKVQEYLKNGQISQIVSGGQVCVSVLIRMCIYAHAL